MEVSGSQIPVADLMLPAGPELEELVEVVEVVEAVLTDRVPDVAVVAAHIEIPDLVG